MNDQGEPWSSLEHSPAAGQEPARVVLLVHHSRSERSRLRRGLSGERLGFVEVSDGVDALNTARGRQLDLILFELRMPGCDGFGTIRRLGADPLTRSIPVIVLSGPRAPGDMMRALELGAIDFIARPVDAEELTARVRVALRTKLARDELEKRAHRDGLTGLANRHALEDRLVAEWALAQRHACPLSVWITDLDDFKAVNDRFGHAAGDDVLRSVAQALRACARAGDFVARFGGEEFVVVAPRCDLPGAIAMAERFRTELLGRVVTSHGHQIRVTASVGVATVTSYGHNDSDLMLHNADRALYQAKSSGGNAVWSWSPDVGRSQPASEGCRQAQAAACSCSLAAGS